MLSEAFSENKGRGSEPMFQIHSFYVSILQDKNISSDSLVKIELKRAGPVSVVFYWPSASPRSCGSKREPLLCNHCGSITYPEQRLPLTHLKVFPNWFPHLAWTFSPCYSFRNTTSWHMPCYLKWSAYNIHESHLGFCWFHVCVS